MDRPIYNVWSGYICKCLVFNKALSENEIKDLASKKRSHPRIAIAGGVVLTLIVLYLIAHQLSRARAICPQGCMLTFGS